MWFRGLGRYLSFKPLHRLGFVEVLKNMSFLVFDRPPLCFLFFCWLSFPVVAFRPSSALRKELKLSHLDVVFFFPGG